MQTPAPTRSARDTVRARFYYVVMLAFMAVVCSACIDINECMVQECGSRGLPCYILRFAAILLLVLVGIVVSHVATGVFWTICVMSGVLDGPEGMVDPSLEAMRNAK